MKGNSIFPLNVVEQTSFTSRRKTSSTRRYIVMDLVRELAAKSSNGQVSFDEIMKHLTGEEFDLTQIEAAQKIRSLVNNDLLILVEDSGLVMFKLYRNISNFERHQRELQEAWLGANELKTFGVIQDEERELRKFQKLQKQEMTA